MERPPSLAPTARGPLRPSAPLWALIASLAVAVVGFQLVFGLRLVAAGDAYWSNPHGDMGQMLTGALAGLRAPWRVPILTPDTLLAPHRVSLVYTDSIPWLTALLKLLHLGGTFSLLGTFLLLAWLAQPAAMYAVLRASGVERASTLLAGSLLALLGPAWLARQIGHIALSGHAVQLAALALAVHVTRTGLSTRSAALFAGLGALAAGIHAYHVPVVTLLFAAALASEVLQRRPQAGRRAAVAGAAYLAAVLFAAWFVGYFVGRGASGGVDALGYYEMNLVGPVLPQASALAGQTWTGGWFTHAFDPTGGEVYEGFNYQGAGVLLVLAAAGLLLWRGRRRRGASGLVFMDEAPATSAADAAGEDGVGEDGAVRRRRWGPLAAALLLLFLYALGTKPYAGTLRLLVLPLPHAPWMEPLALFRCHGRFFWTVGYALLAGALAVLDRSAGARTRGAVLVAAVLLQAADMSQMLGGLHDRFSKPEALAVPPELAGPAFRGRDYRFFPGYFCTSSWKSQLVVRQLSLLAQKQGASTNAAETARPPPDGCAPPPAEVLADAAPGDRRIVVLTTEDGAPSAVTSLFSRRHDCVRADGFWMCGRDLAGVPGVEPVAGAVLRTPAKPDAVLSLGSPGFRATLAQGWSVPEATGVWSDGRRAVLRLPVPVVEPDGFVNVTLDGLGYQPPGHAPQRAVVSVRGRTLARWRLEGGGYQGLPVAVPAELLTPDAPLELAIDLPDALSPNAVTPGAGDPRLLGIGIRKITLAH